MKTSRAIHASKVRFFSWTAVIIGLTAVAMSSRLPSRPAVNADQGRHARKSSEPPVPAQGKLGQDLFLAILHHDLSGVQSLIKRGADPDARNGLSFTPLYMAAATHQADVMRALLRAGAKPEAESPYGTPLTFAASTANVEGANILLSRHVDVNASRADGMTVLMTAANAGSPEIVAELLKRKADVNAKDNDGATALTYAAHGGYEKVGRVLVAAGATINGSDTDRQTPLMAAAVNGHVDFVRMLLQKGANPNARDAKGRTALMLAATYGDYPEVIRALLNGGANAKAADPKGRTAASLAAARGHRESAVNLAQTSITTVATKRSPSQAVQAGVKLLQSSMLRFNEATTCVSCHHEGLGRIAMGTARDHGFRIDQSVQKVQIERINGMLIGMRPLHLRALKDPETMKQVPLIEINEVATTDTWLLAGMAAQNQPPNEATAAMAMVLARQQEPEGNWSFSGPREPMQSSYFTFTALAARALSAYGPTPHAAEIAERTRRAKIWLLTSPTQNSEDRASKLLGLKWTGADERETRKAADAVVADQRSDGGWAQLADLQSDAYATGQALYALHVAGGLPVTDPVYVRGVEYLLRTQDDDGSWFVTKRASPSNNHFDAGFPNGKSQFSSFNGTCWATMALAETVDRGSQQASTPRDDVWRPAN